MPDSTFQTVLPPLKAKDNGDATYAVAVYQVPMFVGTDLTFNTLPPLKAVDNGDGTYSVMVKLV